jgi:uncharacterized protein (TIGR02246 family)
MNSDEQAIRNLIVEWNRATAAADVDAVLRLVAADVVFLVPGQAPFGRAEFEKALRAILKTHRIEARGEIQEVQVSGNMAFCWSFLHVRILPLSAGREAARSGYALSILQKQQSGVWQIARDANLLVDAALP